MLPVLTVASGYSRWLSGMLVPSRQAHDLNASVFTDDLNRARQVGARLRSGTVGHNGMRADRGVSFGGYKQSGIGREGIRQGLQ